MSGLKILDCRLIFAVICALQWSVTATAETSREYNTLTLPIAIYIVDGPGKGDAMSSQRTVEGMEHHYTQVNKIWSQAGIEVDPVAIKRIKAPRGVLRSLARGPQQGGMVNFFRAIRNGTIDMGQIDNGAVVWAFYVKNLAGVNGLNPTGVHSIFVVDDPSNNDYRVTSHEIGHVLGLYHAQDDSKNLLFSGSNGMVLSEVEITVARYTAEKLLVPN